MALARPTPLDTLLFLVSLPTSARHGSPRVLVLVQPHLCKFIWEVMLVSSVARALGDEASDTAAAPTVILSFSQVLHVGRVSSFPFGCCSPRCDHTQMRYMVQSLRQADLSTFPPTHWFLPKLKQTINLNSDFRKERTLRFGQGVPPYLFLLLLGTFYLFWVGKPLNIDP